MYMGGNMDDELSFEITVEELEDGKVCVALVENPKVKVFGVTEEEAISKLRDLMNRSLKDALYDFKYKIEAGC